MGNHNKQWSCIWECTIGITPLVHSMFYPIQLITSYIQVKEMLHNKFPEECSCLGGAPCRQLAGPMPTTEY